MSTSWDYSAVAFIDVLGFSNFVSSDSKALVPIHLDKLLRSIKEVKAASKELDVRAFSDSIVVASPLSSPRVVTLLADVANLQRIFIRNGILVRGAISFGKHYADENLVYSEALISAYIEERDEARFPRILVNDNLLDWLINDVETNPAQQTRIKELLLRDRDHRVFLNYIDGETLSHQLSVLRSFEKQQISASVLEKIQWLGEYHNHFAAEANKELLFDGAMAERFNRI